MHRTGFLKKYGSHIIYVSILGIFTLGFFILSSVYAFNTMKPRTVVLENSLFSSNSPTDTKIDLQIKNVIKLDTPYPVWNPRIVDNNSLVFRTAEQGSKRYNYKICALNINTNIMFEIDSKNSYELLVSPDGKKVLYFDSSLEKGIFKTFLYDMQTKEIRKTFDGSASLMLPDGNRYIGMLNDSLFIQNISTGERENLITITEFHQKAGLLWTTQLIPMVNQKLWNFKFSSDGHKIYFIGPYVEGTAVYMLDLENKNSLEVLIKGRITGLASLTNGNLLLHGNINGEDGIFIYNMQNKGYKNLLRGNIYYFDITSDGNIAYISNNNKGIAELHVAHLGDTTIESDKIVYSDIKNVSFLEWSRNGKMLFCVSDRMNESSIFRFTFQ